MLLAATLIAVVGLYLTRNFKRKVAAQYCGNDTENIKTYRDIETFSERAQHVATQFQAYLHTQDSFPSDQPDQPDTFYIVTYGDAFIDEENLAQDYITAAPTASAMAVNAHFANFEPATTATSFGTVLEVHQCSGRSDDGDPRLLTGLAWKDYKDDENWQDTVDLTVRALRHRPPGGRPELKFETKSPWGSTELDGVDDKTQWAIHNCSGDDVWTRLDTICDCWATHDIVGASGDVIRNEMVYNFSFSSVGSDPGCNNSFCNQENAEKKFRIPHECGGDKQPTLECNTNVAGNVAVTCVQCGNTQPDPALCNQKLSMPMRLVLCAAGGAVMIAVLWMIRGSKLLQRVL